MKTGLNSMYLKKKDDVRFILIVSFICGTIFNLFLPFARHKFEDPAVIYHTGYYHNEKDIRIYLILTFLFLFNLPYFIYGLVTVRNIDFKLYMWYIFLGKGIIDQIKGSSIFLVGLPKITYEEIPPIDDAFDSIVFDISFEKRLFQSEIRDSSTGFKDELVKKLAYQEKKKTHHSFSRLTDSQFS